MRFVYMMIIMLFAGCASSGRPIDAGTVATFERGRTTYPEVIAAMGPPTSTVVMPDGSRTIAYSHATVSTSPATFIPVVGLFAARSDVTSETVAFSFNPAGVLIAGTSSQNQASGGPGAPSR